MPSFADIYVIKKTRSKKLGIEFLNLFLPQREETTDEYLFPQYANEPETEFHNADLLMGYLEKKSKFRIRNLLEKFR